MPGRASAVMASAKGTSKRLFAAYILDWVAIIVIAAIAGGISNITPHYRNFSVIDLSISFPYIDQEVSAVVLAFVAGVIPAIIVVVIVVVLVPGPSTWRSMPRSDIFRWKLWELNVGLLSLAMTHATSQIITQGMKNIAGKPRPDMLARCMPNLNALAQNRVGGYGQSISPAWIMVSQKICTQTDMSFLNEGFRSFPSGHATTSWAGMLWLSLYLASKFNIWFPMLPLSGMRGDAYNLSRRENRQVVYRDEGAAAPTWLLFLIYVPIGVAIYITGTRFFQYWHFGFDLIFGALIGIASAWFSFRWYNLPLGRSAGWAWGPRSRDRAFALGVGRHGWVSDDGLVGETKRSNDIELGRPANSATGVPQPMDRAAVHSSEYDGYPHVDGPHGPAPGRWTGRQDQYEELNSPVADTNGTGFAPVPTKGTVR